MNEPDHLDFYDIYNSLGEDEERVRKTVGRFVDREILPIITRAFDDHRFPAEIVPGIAEMGLFGCNLEGYGCAGLNNVSYGLACQELERGDSGVRSFVSVQGSLCMYPIYTYGSEAQKERWLPRMAAGEAIGCFGLTEPDGGSDPGAMKTRAVRHNGDWLLSGSKAWITNGSIADLAIIWAKTEEGIRGFLVETGTPGFESREILRKYSLRASVTSDLFLDEVRVPQENMLPGAKGLSGPLGCLTQARYGISWGVIGAATACFTEALDFATSRTLFGKAIAGTQTVQRRLAEICRRITTAKLLALQLGRLKDRGVMHPSHVSLAKWNNVRMALDTAREARDILGAGGISLEYNAIRHMLNLETVVTYEGTQTVHELSVGRSLTGMSAF